MGCHVHFSCVPLPPPPPQVMIGPPWPELGSAKLESHFSAHCPFSGYALLTLVYLWMNVSAPNQCTKRRQTTEEPRWLELDFWLLSTPVSCTWSFLALLQSYHTWHSRIAARKIALVKTSPSNLPSFCGLASRVRFAWRCEIYAYCILCNVIHLHFYSNLYNITRHHHEFVHADLEWACKADAKSNKQWRLKVLTINGHSSNHLKRAMGTDNTPTVNNFMWTPL